MSDILKSRPCIRPIPLRFMPFLTYLPHGTLCSAHGLLALMTEQHTRKSPLSVLASNDFFRSMMGTPPLFTTNPIVLIVVRRRRDAPRRAWIIRESRYRLGKHPTRRSHGLVCSHPVRVPIYVLFTEADGCRFMLYKFGPWLRSRSPRALHDDDLKKMKEDAESAA